MRRFFIPSDQITGEHIVMSGNTAHHIANVLRLNKGTQIILFSDDRLERLCEIDKLQKDKVYLNLVETRPKRARPFHIALIQALPKLPKMDLIIEKSTELAVDEIYPVICERSPVQAKTLSVHKRHDRWMRLAWSASEQSRRLDIPKIHAVQLWDNFLPVLKDFHHKLLCTTAQLRLENMDAVLDVGKVKVNERVCVLIGPEGGFSGREIEDAIQSHAAPVDLGTFVLRSETAAIVALTLIQHELRKCIEAQKIEETD